MQLEVVAGDDKGASLVPGGSSSPRRPPTLVAHQTPGPLTTKSVTVGLPIDSFGPNFNLFTYKLTSLPILRFAGNIPDCGISLQPGALPLPSATMEGTWRSGDDRRQSSC